MPLTRREFLKGLGVTVGTFGLSVTGYDHLVPYIHQPEDTVPGEATWYATSCRECPAGCSMVVRNIDSHAVKCEGNPSHPINIGKLCARGQAAVQGLYDPDRIKHPLRRKGRGFIESDWNAAVKALRQQLPGKRIAFVTDLQTGTLASLMRAWLKGFGSSRLITYEPIDYAHVKQAYGGVVPWFDIASSDLLISLSADFLETWVSPVEFAGAFSRMRETRNGTRGGFVYVGPRISATAAAADLRVMVQPGDEAAFAEALAAAIKGGSIPARAHALGLDRTIAQVAQAFDAARAPLVLPGGDADTARAAAMLNSIKSPPVHPERPHAVSGISPQSEMDALVDDMEAGTVDVLVISGANPIYSYPDRKRFERALRNVPLIVSLSSFMDETTAHAHWVLPSDTPLEAWGDYSPYPDVTNLMQPATGRVFDTRHTGDILIATSAVGLGARNYYEYLRQRWGEFGADPETIAPAWEAQVQRGGRWTARTPGPSPIVGATAAKISLAGTVYAEVKPQQQDNVLHAPLHAFPHIYLYDGRGANKRWLQEIPEPMTNAVWTGWVEMHPKTAEHLGVRTDDVITISAGGRKVDLPAYVWSGVIPGALAAPIGQGHTRYGQFAKGVGANIWPFVGAADQVVRAERAGKSKWVSRRKGSTDQHGRDIVQTVRISEPARRHEEIQMPLKSGYGKDDFYPGHDHKLHRWAMVVDTDKCIGCHACETACYAENNLAVSGALGAYRRREMNWLRIDKYMDWRQDHPVLFQPMLCQHCDSAPCESVCPVFAASHSSEGLNMQVYNRCVGTRYCSNNCPYKVRRFNWYDFQWPEPLNWQLNPDVTVRCRGVMEKCTFCIQRIRRAEIIAKREGRELRDGEVVPACVQTCPTGVYTFGDLLDPNSRVSAIYKDDPRAYQVLPELRTKTAVLYLKKVLEG